ncbi:hypothetical protein [Mycobacteroides abscessus]|uniref:hypothetical protein n=1 Tax=Mycobacteroides abscessus TaxID=36809 RepID=UPI000D3E4C8B|nr:hypothetical protein [Mycobacteroides abscessus]PVA69082.1 hypothetical protein DDJ87_00295 [Mycobacteroides abscessus]
MEDNARKRRRQGELKFAMHDYLVKKGEPASIAELKEAVKDIVGTAPDSSYRSSLQDERYFERVSRGVFRSRG